MILYDLNVSGNCYKIRLFLALIGQACTVQSVAFLEGEHRQSDFMSRNPFGEIPVLVDGEVVLRDSQAILVYLARKFDRLDWYPVGPVPEAQVLQWLMVAENEIARGPNDARLHDKFGYELDIVKARKNAESVLELLDLRLNSRDWLELDRPTIADIACFPYVALSHEGGVALDRYPAVCAWADRVKALPGFLAMPGL